MSKRLCSKEDFQRTDCPHSLAAFDQDDDICQHLGKGRMKSTFESCKVGNKENLQRLDESQEAEGCLSPSCPAVLRIMSLQNWLTTHVVTELPGFSGVDREATRTFPGDKPWFSHLQMLPTP